MAEILDTTLREGEQTPDVAFSLKQKISIINALDDFGVDFIEVGHPAVSDRIFDDIKEITKLKTKAKFVGHSRAKKEDIDKVVDSGCEWIGIFMGINELSLKHKYHISKEAAFEKFFFSLEHAKNNGLKVRCSIEDGSRTNFDDWIKVAKEAERIGVDRISYVDTVGTMTPVKIHNQIRRIKQEIKTDLHVHCHNDFGLAVANSLSAYEAGVKCIDVTINGLGERAGLASLSTITAALTVLYQIAKWDLKRLKSISAVVEQYSNKKIPFRQPIIGEDVFTHKGGLHAIAVLENPNVYEILHPEAVGSSRKIVIGSYTSKKVLVEYLKNLNPSITEKEIDRMYKKVKDSIQKDIIWETR